MPCPSSLRCGEFLRLIGKRCFDRIWHTPFPERTLNLATRHLHMGYIDFLMQSCVDFFCGGGLKEKL